MEIYVLYNLTTTILDTFSLGTPTSSKIIGLALGFVLWAGLFLLQAFGLSAMAKGQGLEKRWLAFVPFANLFYMGKLAGSCQVFGQRVKRMGLYAMLTQIATTVFCGLMIAAELYLYIACGEPEIFIIDGMHYLDWGKLTGFSNVVLKFFDNGTSILSIFQLVYEILIFIMVISLYKKYSVRNHMTLSFLNLFIPLSRFIVIFILRNNTPVDYDALMRARREAYLRRQQQYGNPYGGYTPPTHTPPTPPEDPFEEFAEADKKSQQSSQTDFFD